MCSVPAVPQGVLDADRGSHAEQRWHEFAFPLFPEPSGDRRLLDVGCGGGGVMRWAAARGWNVTGIDVSPQNVEAMRRMRFAAEVVDLNGDLPFRDASFDCVVFIEVAEHLVRAEHAFHEISRVVAPGGSVVFTTPNNASYRRRLKALKGRAPDDEGYHFRFWVKAELERKWEDAGLRVTAAASYGFLPVFDMLTFHKARTGKRRIFPISRRWESLFADRFVWRLTKPA